jgi:hypothetical protein
MVAEYTSDFSPLRDLPASAALERAIEEALAMHGRGEAR